MAVRLLDHEVAGSTASVHLDIAGTQRSVTYRFAGLEPDDRYDAFVVAATPVAMRCGAPLRVPGAVSARLLDRIPHAQQALNAWFPELRPVEVEARAEPALAGKGRGVACFFSGGVDSFYSVLENRDRLDALIHVHGFDVGFRERERGEEVRRAVRVGAGELGLELIEVDTDLRMTSNKYVPWGTHYHGAGLASVALLLAPHFREVLIPASYTYSDLHPWGSHPALDPLWSTEAVEIVHDRPYSRTEKLELIAESDAAMRRLRVCFRRGIAALNCGRCEKCLRTMAGLRLAGALERCSTFPAALPLWRVATSPVTGPGGMAFTRQNLEAARAAGDRDLARALRVATWIGPHRARMRRARERWRKRLRRRARPARRAWRRLRRRTKPLRRRLRRLRRAR